MFFQAIDASPILIAMQQQLVKNVLLVIFCFLECAIRVKQEILASNVIQLIQLYVCHV
jgi:hypothetical protein